MLNLPELEKKWFRYKVKLFLPYIITITLIVIVIFVYILLPNEKKSAITNRELKNKIIQVSERKTDIVKTKKNKIRREIVSHKTTPIETNFINNTPSKGVTLSPSMNFLKSFQAENKRSVYQTNKLAIKSITKPKKQHTKVEVHIQKKEHTVSSITIVKQDTKRDIQNILLRFKKDQNPALSLFLAKKYYEIGDYQQAYNYALITNEMNKKIEGSWLIFAKSLVKLNQKNKAIGILSRYVKNTHSTNGKILLEEIQSGAFK
ncbi:tetratricopeptide repeat protein [Sulfurimonas sp.]